MSLKSAFFFKHVIEECRVQWKTFSDVPVLMVYNIHYIVCSIVMIPHLKMVLKYQVHANDTCTYIILYWAKDVSLTVDYPSLNSYTLGHFPISFN